MSDLSKLTTELRNPRSEHIDALSTLDMLTVINDEDATVSSAVRNELPRIAEAVDAIASRFASGGRLFYIGAGTSGRLGVLDASECPPTFSVPPTLFQGLIAGGDGALRRSSESAEDSPEQGARDLDQAGLAAADTVIGIAASGRTPYVIGAVAHANQLGALSIALTCVPDSEISQCAAMSITPITGPEVLTGSTRLKAGTATKLVLNMLSTAIMIRMGATFGNLMVNVQPTNSKLVDRARRILSEATHLDGSSASRLLDQAGDLKTAIVMHRLSVDANTARGALAAAGGSPGRAILPSE